jgi:transposase InsO family protein
MRITELNQVWVSDITYIRFGRKFIYLAIILDAF